MLPAILHVLGIAVVVGVAAFSASFGSGWQIPAVYALSAGLGVVLYRQDERRVVESLWGNVLVGVLLGAGVSVALGTGMMLWYLDLPVDLVAWRILLLSWDSWLGVSGSLLVTLFVVAMADSFR